METLKSMDNFSEGLKRALLIAPPPPPDLEVIGFAADLKPLPDVNSNPQKNSSAKGLSNQNILFITLGVVAVGGIAYIVYKKFFEPKKDIPPKAIVKAEPPVTQLEHADNELAKDENPNIVAQQFFGQTTT